MTLICGRHRLEACKLLGWTDIPAVIEDVGGPQAERSAETGAASIVWAATLPADGPTGGFFRDEAPIPW